MSFRIIRNDITKVKADAIVNTANPKPVVGSGTDSAIYQAAGKTELLAARKRIGNLKPGQAAETPAFALGAKYIIHTVGPAWVDGNHGERDILHACYANSLALANRLHCESIAFPLIATGVYGFPKDEALQIALSEIGKFLLTHELKVTLVVFDRKALELSEKLVGGIEQFVDEHYVRLSHDSEYGEKYAANNRRRKPTWIDETEERFYHGANASLSVKEPETKDFKHLLSISSLPDVTGKSLDDVVGDTGENFRDRLLKLIADNGMDQATVYNKANIDRRVYSRMLCKTDYKPKKKTAVAYAIALELDLPTTLDLLSRAEFTLSPSSRSDLIITYFITHKIYDIFEINAALFKYGQPILGE